jgi:hypothetical protein
VIAGKKGHNLYRGCAKILQEFNLGILNRKKNDTC